MLIRGACKLKCELREGSHSCLCNFSLQDLVTRAPADRAAPGRKTNARINAEDQNGGRAFYQAVAKYHKAVGEYLLGFGAEPLENWTDGRCPFTMAGYSGHLSIM